MIYYKDGAKMMRPVLTREEYMALRDSERQRETLKAVREGHEEQKNRLAQMNYSCLPNGDGTLKGSTRMSSTIGMDIDHVAAEEMESLKERILSKKESLGLLMLEESARGRGYHLVFRRRTELSQEENLRWASGVLGVEYDTGAKDITRVFFTTTAKELLFLDDEIFRLAESSFVGGDLKSPTQGNGIANADEQSMPSNVKSSTLDVQCFKGIPYSSIIKEYWLRTDGEPQQGERNVKLHKLAVNLRAICDNKKEVLMAVMPRYGLTEAEMKSIVDSACKEEPKGVSRVIQQILAPLLSPEGDILDEEPQENSSPLGDLKRGLPIGLKESLKGVPEGMQMPVLCAVLPIAGAYADQVEVEYCDGTRQRLGMMSIIRG